MKLNLVLVLIMLGCGDTQKDIKIAADQAQLAIDLSEYTAALDACRAKGKDAGAYTVYESCAHDADIRYGRISALDSGVK